MERVVSLLLFLVACGPATVQFGPDSDVRLADTGPEDSGEPSETGDTGDTGDSTDLGDTADSAETGDPASVAIAIDLLLPATGSTQGGDEVVLYGGPFDETAEVRFGDRLATVTSWSTTTLTVATPSVAEEGAVDVAVTTVGGEGFVAEAFVYEAPCAGVVPDATYIVMDLQTVNDATVVLTGCATGIVPRVEVTNVVWFESYPSEVDGSGEVTIRFVGNAAMSGYVEHTIVLGMDQGDLAFTIHAQ